MSTSHRRVAFTSFAALGGASLLAGALGLEPPRWVGVTAAAVGAAALVVAALPKRARPAAEPDRADRRRRVNHLFHAGTDVAAAYQPIRVLATGETVGYEAFARFDDGRSPAEWFAEAAELGLDVELELAAIGQAVRSFDGGGYLSLNVGARTLRSPELLRLLDESTALPPLVIEVLEGDVVDDYEAVSDAIDALRQRGARIAIADVGSATSSLRAVLGLVPEVVKLDRSLIADLDQAASKHALVASLAEFCREIGVDLVAEGIETPAELEACETIGVTFGQGHLLGRPGLARHG